MYGGFIQLGSESSVYGEIHSRAFCAIGRGLCIDKRHTLLYIYCMVFDWDESKNDLLKKTRNISFEQIIVDIENGNILDILANSRKAYRNQLLIVIDHDNYAYVVPAVKSNKEYFLKTIFPSRKYTDKYLRKTGGKA